MDGNEIVLGNKNVAEAGSTQVNITQNNFDAEKVVELLRRVTGEERKPAENSCARKPKGGTASKVVTTTFRYRWLDTDDNRIGLLYQALLRATVNGKAGGWIDKKTSPDDFAKVFGGEESTVKIRWTGTKQHLKYLFKVMLEKNYIYAANGSRQPWVIVQSHFVDRNNRMFTDWDQEQEPKEYRHAIETIAEILNADLTLEEVMRLMM